MDKAGTIARAPRGTKILIKAFFSAADEIPEGQRNEVVKAASAGIRDEMKAAREKAKVAKAKAKAPAKKAVAKPAPRKSVAAMKKAKAPAPAKAKAARKAAPKKRAINDTQSAIDAAEVAETTSPEAT